MTAKIIDGKAIAEQNLNKLKQEILERENNDIRRPCLAVILVGDDPASSIYVNKKKSACENVGIKSVSHQLPTDTNQSNLNDLINTLNQDEDVDGILVQSPLPKHLDEELIIELISPNKDVDGFHPENFGRMALDMSTFIPATPFGILELLERYKVDTKGKHTVVIGRSHIVGRPMSILMSRKGWPGNSTVTLTHSNTKNITQIISQADIVISALGVPNFLKAEMVKDDAVIIDVGITRVEDLSKPKGYRIVGDVDFDGVSKKASFITPVPGGVGPMTIAMLLKNTLLAREQRAISKN